MRAVSDFSRDFQAARKGGEGGPQISIGTLLAPTACKCPSFGFLLVSLDKTCNGNLQATSTTPAGLCPNSPMAGNVVPENMLHHKLPAEPNCSHSTRQSIHSRQLKSNFHSIRLAPDCELGERGRRATFSWPKPHATEAERPCAYDAVRARPLCTDRSAALRPQWLSSARARSPELGAAGGHGSNKGLTGRSVQEGTAVEVQRPSGARAMGYSFIGSYQSVSGALPLCDPRPSGAPGL